MNKRILSISFVLAMLVGSFSIQSAYAKKDGTGVGEPGTVNCKAGGPGATSCSVSGTMVIAGIGTNYNNSVTCGDGYYACCGITVGAANCIKNPS